MIWQDAWFCTNGGASKIKIFSVNGGDDAMFLIGTADI